MTFYAPEHSRPLRSRHSSDLDCSPASSAPSASPGSVTPPAGAASQSSSSFLSGSVSSLWGGLVRRFSSEPSTAPHAPPSLPHARTYQPDGSGGGGTHMEKDKRPGGGVDGAHTPPQALLRRGGDPRRTASPMRLPPLEPLQLVGFAEGTRPDARLLTRPIAEEIRIMVPARLGIVDEWRLVYSLEQDGASLATLYEKCARYQGKRVGFVLCVRDCEGGLFGAYLSDHPHPAPKYFGTGECFLWRASVLSPLPPPPSAVDGLTTSPARTTTISASAAAAATNLSPSTPAGGPSDPEKPPAPSRSATPQSIRFKAFPYSGINDYYMLCEAHFLSLGAGDGRYGLWLDDSLERGVSSTSQTFGNEPLSDEGEKFGVLGVEVWVIGG